MFTTRVCQTALILASIFSIGLCIKCFVCNSAVDPKCADLTVNDTTSHHYTECFGHDSGQKPFCRKLTQEVLDVEGSERIIRTCGWILSNDKGDFCKRTKSDFILTRSCQCFSDACNSSERISSSMKLPIIINSVFSLLLYFMCRH